MKKLITILATLAVSVSFATAADAEKKKGGAAASPEERFKKLDTNGDGSISLEEFKAGPMGQKDPAKAEEIFKRKDTDGDGKLSLAEFSAGGGKKAAGATAKKGAPAEGAGKASTATDAAGKAAEKPGDPAK